MFSTESSTVQLFKCCLETRPRDKHVHTQLFLFPIHSSTIYGSMDCLTVLLFRSTVPWTVLLSYCPAAPWTVSLFQCSDCLAVPLFHGLSYCPTVPWTVLLSHCSIDCLTALLFQCLAVLLSDCPSYCTPSSCLTVSLSSWLTVSLCSCLTVL